MEAESLRLLISNCISLLSLALLCYSNLKRNRESFLLTSSIGLLLNIVIYIVDGLWISVFSNLASIARNLYNAKAKKPKVFVNILILIAASGICVAQIYINNSFTWYDILPLISLIFYSVMIMVTKTEKGIMAANCVDAVLWMAYDIENTLVLLVVIDMFNVLIEFTHKTLSILDKHYVFVKREKSYEK